MRRVYVDGSAMTGARGDRLPGGWAAVLDDGTVRRGAEERATSTAMELRAAVEGLRYFEDGTEVVLVYDCSAILCVHDRWERGVGHAVKDRALSLELAAEFERLHVYLDWLVDQATPDLHKLAHRICRIEAQSFPSNGEGRVRTARHTRRTHLVECRDGTCAPLCLVPVYAELESRLPTLRKTKKEVQRERRAAA